MSAPGLDFVTAALWAVALWTAIAFFAGAIPFSVLIARHALGVDLRAVGDGNPGGTNVLRAGGVRWGALAYLLDFFKGMLPVVAAAFGAGLSGAALVPVAVAPVAGHAFSPWLGGRGGKAVAATFGIWAGLTFWYVPTLLGLLLALGFIVFTRDGWAVVFALGGVGLHLALFNPDPALLAIWLLNLLIVAYRHRPELVHPPQIAPDLLRRAARWRARSGSPAAEQK